MARRSKYNPQKRRKSPEPRYRKQDDFKELSRDDAAEKFLKVDTGEDILRGPAVKGFGLRRSKEPFEATKEKEAEEESLRQPEYGRVKRTKRRFAKRK